MLSSAKLFHVSENPDIHLFEPRPAPSPDAGVQGNAVWAIDEAHLPLYLLPRECPRLSFTANTLTSLDDKKKFLDGSPPTRVIALESNWFQKIESCALYLYEFSTESFELADEGAGYYISRVAQAPRSITKIENLFLELLNRNIEVRLMPNLWQLRDTVVRSSLQFSVIRFRNALPRPPHEI